MRRGSPTASLVLFLLTVHSSPARPQQPFRFKVEVQNVYLDVVVERNGDPVTNLGKDDFLVFDNGVRQDFQIVNADAVPLSVMLVLDVSGSMIGRKLVHLRSAAHAFVTGLREQDEAGLVTFSHEVRVRRPLGSDFSLLHEALDSTTGGGPTALNDALYVSLKLLEAAKGRPLLLLFTDGLDTASWLDESEVVEIARSSDSMIHVVSARATGGVYLRGRMVLRSSMESRSLLKHITETSGGKVWLADSSEELENIYLEILSEMETRYLLTYQPRDVPEPGWHRIEVRLQGSTNGRIRARAGYEAKGN